MERRFRCCLCGKEFYGWGNNPWPVSTEEEDRCCDECNSKKVIPARIEMMFNSAKNIVVNDRKE